MSSTENVVTTVGSPTPIPYVRSLSRWEAVALATVGSVVGSALIWALFTAFGASFEVLDGESVHEVGLSGVASSAGIPVLVGVTLAALLSYLRVGVIRIAQVVGAVLPLITIAGSVSADTDVATRIGLALMHVVVAGFVVFGLELMRRRIVANK
ncbi:DUF6069 family protein [Rhodococcus sp. NPDC058521]|uniref:DUF6069 family protein n=1 Tax=Rhodococcus sp. NPDC058521 TaxID=3346536 RepID=UPI003659C8C4